MSLLKTASNETESHKQALAELATAFKGAMGAVRRLRGRDTQRHGELGFAHFHLLFALAEHGGMSAGELATAADLTPATVTGLVDGLAAMELIERTRTDRDRRVVTCTLTDHGRKLVKQLHSDYERRWQAALAEFSAAELETTALVVDRLRTFYEELATKR